MVVPPSAYEAQPQPGRSTQPQGRSDGPNLSTNRAARPSRSRLTAGAASYLVSHRGCLHFRIRVPDDLRPCLGRSELRRSLQTPSLRQARPQAMKLAVVAHLIFNLLRGRLAMQQGKDKLGQGWRGFDPEALARLSDARIRELVNAWLDRALADEWESQLLRDHTPRDPDEMRDILIDLYQDDMEALEARDYRRIEPQALGALEEAGVSKAGGQGPEAESLVASEAEEAAKLRYAKLADAMLRARAAVFEASSAPYFDGSLRPYPGLNISIVRQLQEAGFIEAPDPVPGTGQGRPFPVLSPGLPGPSPAHVKGPCLSAAVAKYVEVKWVDWKPSSQKDIPNRLSLFVDIMREVVAGEDLALTAITRDHVRSFCEVLKGLPKSRNKDRDYRGKSLAELARMEIPPAKRMEPSTVAERFTATRSFLKWAEKEYGRDIGFEARWLNDAFQMPKAYKRAKSGRSKSNRDHFTMDELKALFDPAAYLPATDPQPSRFWCPLVALFTGMRINEIAQLRHADLRQEEEEGVWVFDVNSRQDEGKTEAGKRLVPIHPFLMDGLGLLDYSHRAREEHPKSENLFPELLANVKRSMAHTVGQWFTRYRRGLAIGGGSGEKSGKVFHSFRHTVVHKTLRVDLIAPQLVQAVVGHEEKGANIGVTARYAGRYPVATLRDEVICKLTWDQDIPALAELAASKWARGK